MFKIKDVGLDKDNKAIYKDIIIHPIDINNKKDEGTYNLPNEIKFNNSILGNSKLMLGSYELGDKFQENYTYKTKDGKTVKAVYSILPSNINKKESKIIRLKANYTSDNEMYASKLIKNTSDLLENYGIIRYRYLGEYKNVKLTKMNLDFKSDTYTYMEVPFEVSLANKMVLIIQIRGVKYTINLK